MHSTTDTNWFKNWRGYSLIGDDKAAFLREVDLQNDAGNQIASDIIKIANRFYKTECEEMDRSWVPLTSRKLGFQTRIFCLAFKAYSDYLTVKEIIEGK